MDYFEELEKLFNLKDEYVEDVKGNKEKFREISMKIDELERKMLLYAHVPVNKIGYEMASLISTYEGEKYNFYSTNIDVDLWLYNIVYVISPSRMSRVWYNLYDLRDNPDVVVLPCMDKSYYINLLSLDNLGKIMFSHNWGRFTYLEDFIKYVVNYRINNGDLVSEDLSKLRKKFLELKLDEVNNRKIEIENKRKLILS